MLSKRLKEKLSAVRRIFLGEKFILITSDEKDKEYLYVKSGYSSSTVVHLLTSISLDLTNQETVFIPDETRRIFENFLEMDKFN